MTSMAPPARPAPQADTGYRAFLQQQLATQPHNVMAHVVGDEQIWVKRAGAPHGVGRYRAMAVLAQVLRLEVLREGRRQTISVRSGTRPANLEVASANDDEGSAAQVCRRVGGTGWRTRAGSL